MKNKLRNGVFCVSKLLDIGLVMGCQNRHNENLTASVITQNRPLMIT